MAVLAASITIIPVLAPAFGGYLHVWLGWRANFYVVAIAAAILYGIISWKLPETNVTLQNQTSLLRGLSTSFMTLLRSRRVIGLAMVTGLGGGAHLPVFLRRPRVVIQRLR